MRTPSRVLRETQRTGAATKRIDRDLGIGDIESERTNSVFAPSSGNPMKLTQLSLFLENRPGRLIEPTRLLAAEGINVMTLCLADTAEFGILRLIVQDPARAAEVLNAAGWAVNLTDVVAVEVHDQPGGLAEVLEVFEQSELNVEYVYAFTLRCDDRAILVFRFQEPEQAIKALQASGHQVLDAERLEALVG